MQVTAVCVRRCPPPLALDTDEYAKLWLAVREVFGDALSRVRCSTQLSFSSLAGRVFDVEPEGILLG